MSSRISIARPDSRTSQFGYGFSSESAGVSTSRPNVGFRSANPDDPLEKLRALNKQIEDKVDIFSQPLRPHLPAIGRFLIVVTFLEDSIRIMSQWGDQIWYLQQYARHRFYYFPLYAMLNCGL